jgi:hypothetical protein
MMTSAPARRHPAPSAAATRRGPSRRTRALIVAGEGALAAVVGGIVVGGGLGWALVGLAALCVVIGPLAARGAGPVATPGEGAGAAGQIAKLRVHGVTSRSSGEVGVVSDGPGFAAGLEVDVAKGAVLDLAALCAVAAGDPSRPSVVQVRLTTYAPSAPAGMQRRAGAAAIAVHRRLHVLLRLDPAWAGDVVARHGGGAQGSRAALVAAVDRIGARLRRAGLANRVLDTAALNALIAEDTATDVRARLFTADAANGADLDRIIDLLQYVAPERSVVSMCTDLVSSDQWQSFAAVLVAGRDPYQVDEAGAAVLADPCVVGVAAPATLAAVLPLGGGPGDLASVLTLARS